MATPSCVSNAVSGGVERAAGANQESLADDSSCGCCPTSEVVLPASVSDRDISGYGRQRRLRLGNAPINAGIQGAWMPGNLEPEVSHGYPSAGGPHPAVCRFMRLVNLTMRVMLTFGGDVTAFSQWSARRRLVSAYSGRVSSAVVLYW